VVKALSALSDNAGIFIMAWCADVGQNVCILGGWCTDAGWADCRGVEGINGRKPRANDRIILESVY
jgi:hypothetical protein